MHVIGTDLSAAELAKFENSEVKRDLTTWTGRSLLISPRKGVGGNDAFEKQALPEITLRDNLFFSPDLDHAFALKNDVSQLVSAADFQVRARWENNRLASAELPPNAREVVDALPPLRDRHKELGWEHEAR